ncbi:GPR1/FUN34/yaaH family-domain-containing protein [Fennellomyces sp. T-0311]|nr:GPR1/FUN34/yaaH family-domain-containing protein [Fennellomyces sp. T-0311]
MSPVDQKPEVELHESVVVNMGASVVEKEYSGSATAASSDKKQHAHQPHPSGQANPLAIGFAAFSLCSFVFGLYNSGLITDLPQVAVGVALGFGAIGQLYASIGCFIQGETYSATTFMTYSGFFFAFGIMFCSGSGFVEAATADGTLTQLHKCMALVQLAFAVCSLFYFLGTLRQPKLIQLILFLVFCTFFFGCLGEFTGVVGLTMTSGWCSFALALVAWYVMCCLIYTEENTFIRLPFF